MPCETSCESVCDSPTSTLSILNLKVSRDEPQSPLVLPRLSANLIEFFDRFNDGRMNNGPLYRSPRSLTKGVAFEVDGEHLYCVAAADTYTCGTESEKCPAFDLICT